MTDKTGTSHVLSALVCTIAGSIVVDVLRAFRSRIVQSIKDPVLRMIELVEFDRAPSLDLVLVALAGCLAAFV